MQQLDCVCTSVHLHTPIKHHIHSSTSSTVTKCNKCMLSLTQVTADMVMCVHTYMSHCVHDCGCDILSRPFSKFCTFLTPLLTLLVDSYLKHYPVPILKSTVRATSFRNVVCRIEMKWFTYCTYTDGLCNIAHFVPPAYRDATPSTHNTVVSW